MIPLNIHIENNSKLSTVMLRNIERLVCAYDASVADGWRAIIEMQCNGEDHPYFLLDVQSNRGGGNYAEVKMAMLKRFGDLAATVGLPVHVVRFYEKYGIVSPKRTGEGNYRTFEELDLRRLTLARHLRSFGFSLEQTAELLSSSTYAQQYEALDLRAHQTVSAIRSGMIDAGVWNMDEIVESGYQGLHIVELSKDISADAFSSAALVVKRGEDASLLLLQRNVLPDKVREIQNAVRAGTLAADY